MNATHTKRAALQRLQAVLWASLAKIADKEQDRDKLQPGADHHVLVNVHASIDGELVQLQKHGHLKVGHDSESSSSSAPNADHLVGLLLGKIAKRTRDKLLDDLPAHFLEHGELPEVSKQLKATAKRLQDQLRAKKTVTKRGPVHFSEQTPEHFAAELAERGEAGADFLFGNGK